MDGRDRTMTLSDAAHVFFIVVLLIIGAVTFYIFRKG
jgi:hypothetical protein